MTAKAQGRAARKRGRRPGRRARAAERRPRGPGRPPSAPEKVRSRRVVVMLTEGEYERLEGLAARRRIPPSTLAYHYVAEALSRRR